MKKILKCTIVGLFFLVSSTILVAQEISSAFPFESKYLDLFGSKMHYIEEYADSTNPEQTTFLFLHGNPTSSYLWRNIIPYVKGKGRAVAIDLIGMGKSDKPDIDYTFQDHIKYVNAFIEKKKLKNIVLVIHDWGSALGFQYASKNEFNIKGIVFMEALTRPMVWNDMPFIQKIIFKMFRNEKKGHRMIAEKNMFIKSFLYKQGIKRKLSDLEKEYYAKPYPTVASRKPIEVWPKEIPIEGAPRRNFDIVENYALWLRNTNVPKLLLYATPGMLFTKKEVARLEAELKNLKTENVGKGKHYIQEDHPHEIGKSILEWYSNLQESAKW
ncbi:MAG: haloalkane dehalogenase [Chitinophagaceae bacterium]|nr:haloalkane dehalogenase [Chitinophagaceae bacterium]